VELIPFSETRNYVQRIMENLQVYRARFGGGTRLQIEADCTAAPAWNSAPDPQKGPRCRSLALLSSSIRARSFCTPAATPDDAAHKKPPAVFPPGVL